MVKFQIKHKYLITAIGQRRSGVAYLTMVRYQNEKDVTEHDLKNMTDYLKKQNSEIPDCTITNISYLGKFYFEKGVETRDRKIILNLLKGQQ